MLLDTVIEVLVMADVVRHRRHQCSPRCSRLRSRTLPQSPPLFPSRSPISRRASDLEVKTLPVPPTSPTRPATPSYRRKTILFQLSFERRWLPPCQASGRSHSHRRVHRIVPGQRPRTRTNAAAHSYYRRQDAAQYHRAGQIGCGRNCETCRCRFPHTYSHTARTGRNRKLGRHYVNNEYGGGSLIICISAVLGHKNPVALWRKGSRGRQCLIAAAVGTERRSYRPSTAVERELPGDRRIFAWRSDRYGYRHAAAEIHRRRSTQRHARSPKNRARRSSGQ